MSTRPVISVRRMRFSGHPTTMSTKRKRERILEPGPELVTRAAPFQPASVDDERRTVNVVWTTGARVLRGMFDRYYEELDLSPGAVRMDRLQGGAPLLANHNAFELRAVIGVVENAALGDGQGTATLRFARDAEGEAAWQKVRDGILRSVSVGYRVHRLELVEGGEDDVPVYSARDWEPYELSLVPIGADAGAGVRSARRAAEDGECTCPCGACEDGDCGECDHEGCDAVEENCEDCPMAARGAEETDIMKRREVIATAEQERSLAIRRIGRALELDPALAAEHVAKGTPADAFRALATDLYAERTHIPISSAHLGEAALLGRAGGEGRVKLMAEALASRFGGPAPTDAARQYVFMGTVDLARTLLEERGVHTRSLSKAQVIDRVLSVRASVGIGANSTSDFPLLLQETGVRILRQAYALYEGGLKNASRKASAADFRPISKLQIGELGPLLKVNEGGEFTNTSTFESKESYSLATYGRIFGITRQALINDDLSAFGDMAKKLGRAAAEFEANQLVALLTSNPTLGQDSTAVFHANHGNLAASGSAIGVTSLAAAVKAMRLQKSLDGVTAINVTPKYLVVPATQELAARQAITQITPAQTSNVNPFAGTLDLIVEPRLDAFSTTAWYLVADSAMVDTLEYAYLDGANGPDVMMQEGWRIDAIEWKVRLDYGCAILDFRGLYTNPGA